MLTSPVNVTIAAGNGIALKANTATSDHGAHREPPLPPHHPAQAAEAVIEPELPSNSPMTSVNAVTATVASRTVLQELTLGIATMMRIARRPDENLTALFLRIIAAIESMPQAERLQFEIRAGLKPLKITLADLVMALRKPDGQEAARLTATAEAPTAMPGRTAANAATTTYLEEGTDSGHTEETLAMRAAARNSAAGQSLFSAENKVRPAEAQPTDAKVLQNHLKTMFEAGEGKAGEMTEPDVQQEAAGGGPPAAADFPPSGDSPLAEEHVSIGDTNAKPVKPQAAPVNPRQLTPAAASAAGAASAASAASEAVIFSSANLKLDPLTVEKIRAVAQSITDLAETVRAEQGRPADEKVEDRRLQTMLTLKGLAEVVSAIPAKAAELLAAVVAEASAPLPEPAEPADRTDRAEPLQLAFSEAQLPELSLIGDEAVAQDAVISASSGELPVEMPVHGDIAAADSSEAGNEAEIVTADERQAAPDPERLPPSRPDITQHAVPFVYAQVQPARDEIAMAAEEDQAREEDGEDPEDDGAEDGERRRPRDEYDEIHDPLPEEDPAIVITRDSSEADRAFALYQRMGGF